MTSETTDPTTTPRIIHFQQTVNGRPFQVLTFTSWPQLFDYVDQWRCQGYTL